MNTQFQKRAETHEEFSSEVEEIYAKMEEPYFDGESEVDFAMEEIGIVAIKKGIRDILSIIPDFKFRMATACFLPSDRVGFTLDEEWDDDRNYQLQIHTITEADMPANGQPRKDGHKVGDRVVGIWVDCYPCHIDGSPSHPMGYKGGDYFKVEDFNRDLLEEFRQNNLKS